MSVNTTTQEDFQEEDYFLQEEFERPLIWTDSPDDYIDLEPQIVNDEYTEPPVVISTPQPQKTVIDTLYLQENYPYIVLSKDTTSAVIDTTQVDILDWITFTDSDEYRLLESIRAEPDQETASIKEIYPGLEGNSIPPRIQNEIWFIPLLLLLFFCYGLTLYRKKKFLLQDLRDSFTPTYRNASFRGDTFTESFRARALLIALGIINASLFSFFAFTEYLGYTTEKFTLVLSLFLGTIALFSLLKIVSIKLISYVFFDKDISLNWTRTFNSMILFLGVGLIPVLLILSFGPVSTIIPSIYTGLFFIFCGSVMYLFKVGTFFFRSLSSLFYLILYLCTLEILPALGLFLSLKGIITMV